MSLRSMTGYGHGSAVAGGVRVDAELSSINRKQMDISLSLPRALAVFEPRMDELIRRAVSRGRVTGELTLHLSSSARQRAVRVDRGLARAYLRALRGAARAAGLRDDLGASALLNLPEVVRYETPGEDAERLWPLIERGVAAGLKNLLAMRLREGRALQRDLEKRFRWIAARLSAVRKEAPRVAERYRAKLAARLKEAGFTVESSDERVLKDLAFFADRSDIQEEITRLDSHIRQAYKLMLSAEPVGRALDFLAQEMFRELNTMGSKANDGGILKDVVALKAELERIREQVQNVE